MSTPEPSPQLKTILAALRRQGASSGDESIEQARRAYESRVRLFPPADDLTVVPIEGLPSPAEWVAAPGCREDRVVLFLHGGAYVKGSLNTHRDLAGRLSTAVGARVLSADYRLAPEHPFPAAVDDAGAAYRWLLDVGGVEPEQVTLAGDSAGGGLGLGMLVVARDEGVPLPAAIACMSPWVDLEAVGESMVTRAGADPLIQREALLRVAARYLNGQDPRTPAAAPLHADFEGFPPLLVQVGDRETLLDDSRRLVDRARAQGVEATLRVWPEMFHGWQLFARILPEGQQAIDEVGEFLAAALGIRPAVSASLT